MTKISKQWLNIKDYIDNAPWLTKISYKLKMITFSRQIYMGGLYTGKFKFNFKNPLTWIMFFIILSFTFPLYTIRGLFESFIEFLKDIKDITKENIEIDINEGYKSKYNKLKGEGE